MHITEEDPKSPPKRRRDVFLQLVVRAGQMLPGSNGGKKDIPELAGPGNIV